MLILLPIGGRAASLALPPPGQDVIGQTQQTHSRQEDTLSDIARKYDLGYDEIVAANPDVDPWLPGEGTAVILPTRFILPPGPREGIVINLAELRLYYFPPDGKRVITHPIGIGREGWSTPTGEMRIVAKTPNPEWRPPETIRAEHAANGDPLPKVVPPGPDNPLGDFAMRLSNPMYLLHGTNKPWGVGMRVSHGCIRLYPEDIKTLFPLVKEGTPVRIINQPYKAGWLGDMLFVEAHPPLSEQLAANGMNFTPLVEAVIAASDENRPLKVEWERAHGIAKEHTGIPTLLGQTSLLTSIPLSEEKAQEKRHFLLRFSHRPTL